MAFGAIDAATVRQRLATVAANASGATEIDHVGLDQAPETTQHRGFALEELSWRDLGGRGHRSASSTVRREYIAVLRYAYRIAPGDPRGSRDTAVSDVEAVERALRAGTDTELADMDVEIGNVRERRHSDRSWWVWDVPLRVLTLFDMAGS